MNKITLEHFKKNLEEQIAKIELQALDDEAVSSISLHFHKDTSSFKMDLYEDLTHDVVLDLEMLQLSGSQNGWGCLLNSQYSPSIRRYISQSSSEFNRGLTYFFSTQTVSSTIPQHLTH